MSAGGINFNIAFMSFLVCVRASAYFATTNGFTLYHILSISIIRTMFYT